MKKNPWKGVKVLVTAGPTREFLDPVRFLSNPSSGKMGYALAAEANRLGADVTLISGPTTLTPPPCRLIRIVSASDLDREAMKVFSKVSLIFMTAAVSDFTPVTKFRHKVKKKDVSLTLKFKPTVDILKKMGTRKKPGQILVGFAAETQHLAQNALKKLNQKNLDAIVANDVSDPKIGFESKHNAVTLYVKGRPIQNFPRAPKTQIARKILSTVQAILVRSRKSV